MDKRYSSTLISPGGDWSWSTATKVSETNIVGYASDNNQNVTALRWSNNNTIEILSVTGELNSAAMAISGHTSVGIAWPKDEPSPLHLFPDRPLTSGAIAIRWNEEEQGVALPTLGGIYSAAYDIDNSTIVGCSMRSDALIAVMWNPAGLIQEIGSLGGNFAVAMSISGDVVVGGSNLGYDQDDFIADNIMHAFSWTYSQGIIDIHPEGWTWSIATGVDRLGNIVGYGKAEDGYTHGFAYIKAPDLMVESYTIRPDDPKVHERIYFDAVIKNIGTGPAILERGWNRLRILKGDGSWISHAGYTSPGTVLQPLESITETIYFMPYTLEPGDFSFILRTDPTDIVAESDETNNDYAGTLTVPPRSRISRPDNYKRGVESH